QDGSNKTKSGPDGRYTITLKCQGTTRAHVTRMWATKPGFVRAYESERHKLLPGQTAELNFRLKAGEPFGGTLKVRQTDDEPSHKLIYRWRARGPDVKESVFVQNGEKFELTLPPGSSVVELKNGGKTLKGPGLKTGKPDPPFKKPPFQFTPETVGAAF